MKDEWGRMDGELKDLKRLIDSASSMLRVLRRSKIWNAQSLEGKINALHGQLAREYQKTQMDQAKLKDKIQDMLSIQYGSAGRW